MTKFTLWPLRHKFWPVDKARIILYYVRSGEVLGVTLIVELTDMSVVAIKPVNASVSLTLN